MTNITFMPHTTDPRQFWGLTRVCLMPSLWWENQSLVAIEAMINGIPVIGSNRGGLPETLGNSGTVLPLPERLAPRTDDLPTVEEVEPWIAAIIRMWDDAAHYEKACDLARKEALRWHPDRLRPVYANFFDSITPQPSPPLIPK